ncbi:rhomboid-domain-containing protein, partial [Meira miltonrushii]
VPSNFMFWFIMGLNVIVFGMWQLAISQAEQGDPTLFFLMFKNFTSGLSNFFEGRYWTLLTACFSHKDYAHMFVNMLTYFFFGRTILNLVGGRSFLFFYFAAGLASSSLSLFSDFLGHDASRPKEGQQKKPQFSLGASGSIIAIVTCFSSIKPRATFLFYFILPVQARLLIPALLLYDLWGMFGTEPHKTLWDKNTFVDSAGHVGGIIAGRLYWIFKLKRFRVMW